MGCCVNEPQNNQLIMISIITFFLAGQDRHFHRESKLGLIQADPRNTD